MDVFFTSLEQPLVHTTVLASLREDVDLAAAIPWAVHLIFVS